MQYHTDGIVRCSYVYPLFKNIPINELAFTQKLCRTFEAYISVEMNFGNIFHVGKYCSFATSPRTFCSGIATVPHSKHYLAGRCSIPLLWPVSEIRCSLWCWIPQIWFGWGGENMLILLALSLHRPWNGYKPHATDCRSGSSICTTFLHLGVSQYIAKAQ